MLTAADKAVRATRIGASEVAAVLGLSPFAGPFDVYARLVHQIERAESTTLTAGQYLELAVLAWYRDKTGHPTTAAKSAPHPQHDWLSATPDAQMFYAEDGDPAHEWTAGAVEAKTSRNRDDWGEDESDQVPVAYACQAQVQLAVGNMQRCDMPVLFTQTGEFGLYVIKRDDDAIRHIIDTCGAWYRRHVVEKVMPDLDGGSAAAEYLRRKWPSHTSGLVAATPEQEALARAYAAAKEAEAKAASEAAVTRQNIINGIGSNEGWTFADGGKMTFRATKAGNRVLRHSRAKEE